jgi:hypothetical protein
MSRIVCNNPNNFSKAEVLRIRAMNGIGWGDDDIAAHLGVDPHPTLGHYRIRRVIDGETYRMVA